MLKRNHIPDKEPIISVGIIMPEDKAKNIIVEMPDKVSDRYLIYINNKKYELKSSSVLEFKIHNNITEIEINGVLKKSSDTISIFPEIQKEKLMPKSGLKVKNVISGRDFHWKKNIDVYLPDKIIISPVNGFLFLVNELPLEHYLMCVATSEMNAACPDALIKSQTIVARSWILAAAEQKHKELGLDACNDDCCQRYQGTTHLTEQSVKGSVETSGIAVLYKNEICDTRYSKSCGGMTESYDTIWEEKRIPYLKVFPDSDKIPEELSTPLSNENNFKKWINSVPNTFCSPHIVNEDKLIQYLGSVDEHSNYFRWQRYVSQSDITDNINKIHNVNAMSIKKAEVTERGGSGRIKHLRITYINSEGEEKYLMLHKDFIIRQTLDKTFLYSSAIIIEEVFENENKEIPLGFKFFGAGWGHGVGYCQIGALGMALKGYNSTEIVLHYFPGSKSEKIY